MRLVPRLRARWAAGGLLSCLLAASAPALTLEERAAALRPLESARARLRAGAVPQAARAAALPERERLLAAAAETLRKETALRTEFGVEITPALIQAELDRMVRDSRDPQTLRVLLASLGNDPVLAAELLARPLLADRLLRSAHAARAAAQALPLAEAAAAAGPGAASAEGARVREFHWMRSRESAERWAWLQESLAVWFGSDLRPGRRSAPRRGTDGVTVVELLDVRPDSVRLRAAEWPSPSFDAWWASLRGRISASDPAALSGMRLDSPAACSDDRWDRIEELTNVPEPRTGHTAVWTGLEMIVWGGLSLTPIPGDLASGGAYTPALDSWSPTAESPLSPVARHDHTAVWTGVEMLIWGGRDSSSLLSSGSAFSPAGDDWQPIKAQTFLGARASHSAIWSGSHMIVWAGETPGGILSATGAGYDPFNRTWYQIATAPGSVGPRAGHTAIWTGTQMVVWGGHGLAGLLGTGGTYTQNGNSWLATPGVNAPAAREKHRAIWTGVQMIVWGGEGLTGPRNDGAALYLPGGPWAPMTTAGAPTARCGHSAVWSGSEMVVWGGDESCGRGGVTRTGGRYDPGDDSWRPTNAQSSPDGRTGHSAVWAGDRMIMWGGRVAGPPQGDGASYCALGGSCTPITWYQDSDGDHFGNPAVTTPSCLALPGYVPVGGDCNDGDPLINPQAADSNCNGKDENCSGAPDEQYVPIPTSCGTGACARAGQFVCIAGLVQDTCVPGVPSLEICDGIDNDCDGNIDILPPPVAAASAAPTPPLPLVSVTAQGPAAGARPEERLIAAAVALEEVLDRRRSWPAGNPGSRPAFDRAAAEARARARLDSGSRQSTLVASKWSRAIGPAEVQAELDRIGRETQDPSLLQDLFHALGDDARLAAETLARPLLVERTARSLYSRDAALHAATRAAASAEWESLRSSWNGDASRWLPRARAAAAAAPGARLLLSRLGGPATAELLPVGMDGYRARAAALPQFSAALEETDEAFVGRMLLSSGADGSRVAELAWPKIPFDVWWAGESWRYPPAPAQSGGAYQLPATAATPCTIDTWTPTTVASAPAARSGHTAIWTGVEMIVWGGIGLNSGGRYFPATDSWLPTSVGSGVPVGRDAQTAVWTGTEMIVWGGQNSNGTFVGTGGRYNPATDTWSPTPDAGAPTARAQHTAVWTGTEMIVWGGFSPASTQSGGRYSPATNSWTPTPLGPTAPAARGAHGVVWTGTEMIVWGGATAPNVYPIIGGRLNPATGVWIPTSTNGQLVPGRALQATAWIPPQMFVWGGIEGYTPVETGAAYDVNQDDWRYIRRIGVPPARYLHTGVEARGELLVWGGLGTGSNFFNTGGRYDSATDTWTPTAGLVAPTARIAHTATSTGPAMIIWGGFNGFFAEATGASYCIGCIPAPVYRDADGDGWGDPAVSITSCGATPGYVTNSLDCDDTAAGVNPGHLCDRTCDGADDNCSGAPDEGYQPVSTQCGLGVCARTGNTSCSAGTVLDSCVPGTPGQEVCGDGLDNDCDGAVDNGCP